MARQSQYYSHDSKLTLLVPTTTGIVHRVRLQLDPSYPLKLCLDGFTIELLEIEHLLVQVQKFRSPADHFGLFSFTHVPYLHGEIAMLHWSRGRGDAGDTGTSFRDG